MFAYHVMLQSLAAKWRHWSTKEVSLIKAFFKSLNDSRKLKVAKKPTPPQLGVEGLGCTAAVSQSSSQKFAAKLR